MAVSSAEQSQVIKNLVKAAQAADAPLVGSVDTILRHLEEAGYCYRATLLPRQIGVAPSNRDGYGVNAEDVHSLGHDIAFMGWSWSEVSKAICIEEQPGATYIEDFNTKLTESSELLPPVVKDSIRYGSISCSHTNMFLRSMAHGVKSSDDLVSVGGKLSLEHLAQRDHEFARAVREGLPWSVLSWRVEAEFPGVLSLIQSARNASGQVARSEHEMQVMLRIQALALSEQKRTGNAPDWAAISKTVLRSRPPCAADIRELQVFVATCGGGTTGSFLDDLGVFHRQCVNSDLRTIRGAFYKAVAELSLDGDIPYFKIALVKTQYTCPKAKVNRAKECAWISTGDLASCQKTRQQKVMVAEDRLCEARAALASAKWETKVPEPRRVVYLAKMDTLIVRWVLEKQDKAAFVAKSADCVMNKVLSELKVEFPSLGSMVDKMLASCAVAADSMPSGSSLPSDSSLPSGSCLPSVKLQEFRDGKSVDGTAALRKKGFDLGNTVVRNGSSDGVWLVQDVKSDAAGVHIVCMCSVGVSGQTIDPLEQKVALKTFLEVYVRKAVVEVVVKHPFWPQKAAEQSEMYKVHVAKCRIHSALCHVGMNAVSKRAVDVIVKPSRTVKATYEASKGSVVLVPETLKIQAVKDDEDVPEACQEVVFDRESAVHGYRFFLAPTFSDEFVNPTFAVKTSADDRLCNMVWAMVSVNSVQVLDWPHEVQTHHYNLMPFSTWSALQYTANCGERCTRSSVT
jgi:hypothetical protein